MESKYYCAECKCSFVRKYLLDKHKKSIKHMKRADKSNTIYSCTCGKTYTQKKNLDYHIKNKKCEQQLIVNNSTTENTIQAMQDKLDNYEKEHYEMKAQIAMLLEKPPAQTTNMTNSNNNNSITININAFGNENIDYLDDKAIMQCIERVYKSIPSLLEKIHFDPKHPENHNVRITNKKLPYASVMGKNKKWESVDRKNAIDTMVHTGYNMLDLTYSENKEKIPIKKQQHFEGFQSKFESDDKELMKQIKSDVEMMLINA